MTRRVLIVGAGPAAVGAALACLERSVDVTIIDVGGRLEEVNEHARARMAEVPHLEWSQEDVATVSRLPVASAVTGLPEKRAFGSDFPFRNFGQLAGFDLNGVNPSVVSGAYGGFSNIWGAQTMPFTSASFRDWPVTSDEMYRHYRTILEEIPFAAEEDDLAELFPLLARSDQLPRLSERSAAALGRYALHRRRLRTRGVVLGRARLAMNAYDCVRCGLCLTGCPYRLIYSASHTLDRLRQESRITYHGGLLAVEVEERDGSATVVAKELDSGRLQRFSADRVLLACGAIGTSRLVMGSLRLFDAPAEVAESAQFMLPFLSAAPTASDPRRTADFTLNQFNMLVTLDPEGYDASQLHFYTYDSAFLDALPSFLRSPSARIPRVHLLRRLSVALGYLPSWASPRFTLRARAPSAPGSLPGVTFGSDHPRFAANRVLRGVLRRIVGAAPLLDLWPALPLLRMSAPGKSYHWGATFPHSDRPQGTFSSDTFGRVGPWTRVHLVDASVFPTVPATTFTLTVMANAHRIADSALRELDS